jgi:bloom syndrome protein
MTGKQIDHILQAPAVQNWDTEGYSWSPSVREQLIRMGMTSLRPNQLPAINAAMAKCDVFLRIATGQGKTLCFILPAALNAGLTVVVTPLIALMRNHNHSAKKMNVLSEYISSDEKGNIHGILDRIKAKDSRVKVLFVSAERIEQRDFQKVLVALNNANKLARIVVDEAHCITQWGHDFRPAYKQALSDLRLQFSNVPFTAVTATANNAAMTDIKNILGFTTSLRLVQILATANRPNLFYSVKNKTSLSQVASDIYQRLMALGLVGKTGIVYCFSRKNTEEMEELLNQEHRTHTNSNNAFAIHYHAGIANRQEVEEKWNEGVVPVVCSTTAFGMGIDNSNVRFVYHATIPQSIEAYFQESGRGGRDGKHADCVLYYSTNDVRIIKSMLAKDSKDTNVAADKAEALRRIETYCYSNSQCRRKTMLTYLNEMFIEEQCNAMCDICRRKRLGQTPQSGKPKFYQLTLFETLKRVADSSKQGHDIRKMYKLDTLEDDDDSNNNNNNNSNK